MLWKREIWLFQEFETLGMAELLKSSYQIQARNNMSLDLANFLHMFFSLLHQQSCPLHHPSHHTYQPFKFQCCFSFPTIPKSTQVIRTPPGPGSNAANFSFVLEQQCSIVDYLNHKDLVARVE